MVEHSAVNRVVVGSSPTRGVFFRLHGQAVKTPPFHGGNRGSNPLGVIFLYRENRIEKHSHKNGKSRKMKNSHIKRDVLTKNGKSRAFKKSLRDALD